MNTTGPNGQSAGVSQQSLLALQKGVAATIRTLFPYQAGLDDETLVSLEKLRAALAEAAAVAKERPANMPAILRSQLQPHFYEGPNGIEISFSNGVVIDSLTHPDQVPERVLQTLKDRVPDQLNKPHAQSTTEQWLLGLAFAPNAGEQLLELSSNQAGIAVHSRVLDAQSSIATHRLNEKIGNAKFNAQSREGLITQKEKLKRHMRSGTAPEGLYSDRLSGSYAAVLDGKHPSGLSFARPKLVGHDASQPEGSQSFDDTLVVISVMERADDTSSVADNETLVVGKSNISDELKAMLKERCHITYVQVNEPGAKQTIESSVQSILQKAEKQKQAANPDFRDHGGLATTLNAALTIRDPEAFRAYIGNISLSSLCGDPVQRLVKEIVAEASATTQSEYASPQLVTNRRWADFIEGQSDRSPEPFAR